MVWELDLDLRFIWKLGIGNFRSGLVGGVEFPQTIFQISSKTKFQGPNEAEPLTGLKARQHEAQGFSPVLGGVERRGLKGRQRGSIPPSLPTFQAGDSLGFWNLNIGSYLEIGLWKFPSLGPLITLTSLIAWDSRDPSP
jgi:hypothetical protein